ncbi:MAG: aspartate--tRNA(Asn) ligase, partial [Nanoarchaeota archaeon]|nr:aspartate--tRNA(Asn) ligase [Nanoarchaeota archaeon]
RAEKSHTTRHVAEILMLDMEMSFINSVEDVMNVVEKLMFEICTFVNKNEEKSLKILNKKIEIPKMPFPRITLDEAKKLLEKKGLSYKQPNEEINFAGEKALCEIIKEKYGHEFVFLTEFPWSEAKFYHKQNITNPKVAERCDLLYNGVEIATITQREHRYDILLKQVKKDKVNPEKIKFYLDAFRYGMPPHGGAGIGIDRIVQQLLALSSVQEAVLFPRTSERITP